MSESIDYKRMFEERKRQQEERNKLYDTVSFLTVRWNTDMSGKWGSRQKEGAVMGKVWDLITCPNNHPLYLLVKNINAGDPLDHRAFLPLADAPKIIPGTFVCRQLCHCGSPIFPVSGGIRLYVKGRMLP